MFLETDQDYLDEALEVQRRGYRGYKLHPPGPADRDMALYTAVRELVGGDYALMTDPVATHSYAEALRVGRHLETLGYLWFEEPICDHDMYTLQKLTATLDIPIAATEAIAGLHTSTASYIANRACDIVRADVSWRGGITGVMKIATLAEAFGMKCEIHTSIYEALEFGNLHCALAVSNSDFLELLYPVEDYSFGIRHGLPIADGYASAPRTPGAGRGVRLGLDRRRHYLQVVDLPEAGAAYPPKIAAARATGPGPPLSRATQRLLSRPGQGSPASRRR